MKLIDLTGRRFGRLVVKFRYKNKTKKRPQWICKCDCGNWHLANGGDLRSGDTRSCGCYMMDVLTTIERKTHGMTSSREYKSWESMRQRCNNPKDKSYNHYGGRGISICERWNSFEAFYEDMGDKPDGTHTIDRINVNGNYTPGNCRWATQSTQQQNRRNNVMNPVMVRKIRKMFTAGKTHKQIADHFNIATMNIYHLLNGKTWKNVK